MLRLDHKTAVITGVGSGIGKAIAELFARQGATVCILDLDQTGGNAVVESIRADQREALFLPVNVASQEDVQQVIQTVVERYGTINSLVNNAGIAHVGNAETTSTADFGRLMRVNVQGVYNCLHAVLPIMKQNGGVILNMASVAGLVGLADRFAYSATKGAVVGMTLSVAKDYLAHPIRCNCISPGRVHTPFVDGFLAKNYPGQEAEMFD